MMRDPAVRVMIGLMTAILMVGALVLGRPVFAPLAFALFIIVMVWPLQARLQAFLPKLLALAVRVLATVLVAGACCRFRTA